MRDDFPELNLQIKVKRKKRQKLTGVYNRRLAKARIIVEHTFTRMKKVMGEEFRNRLKNYDVMTDIVSGLVNLRIMGS
ncbi:MAG: transposase family protein [Conexivisphaerales archaeon]